MISKKFKIIFFCFAILYQNISYSKNTDLSSFNEKNVYNYFSALISSKNNQDIKSLNFFNSSKNLKEIHKEYIKKYIFSLIVNGKINRAVKEIETLDNKNFLNFFEAQLLLFLNSLKKKDYESSYIYIKNLKTFSDDGTFELIISSILEEYLYIFKNNQTKNNLINDFGKLSLINKTLQSCYLDKSNTKSLFQTLINFEDIANSRYLFFYANYLLSQNNFKEITNLSKSIDPLNSTLLVSQTKNWIEEKKFEEIENIFSCKDPDDIISEFFFVISNLYSGEGYLSLSNFYFKLSNYFNPKFKFNSSLIAENYLQSKDYEKSKNILYSFNKKNKIYHWYKIKKITEIIKKDQDSNKALNYLQSEFNKIKNPSIRMLFDMGNIVKGFKRYNLSIEYYSKVLSQMNNKDLVYAEILYRRGGSYERIGKTLESDNDLLMSLKINPDEPHVLNYLAYSWLERNYNIDQAMIMLEKAYEQRKNDPYIIDSIGWAYYLTGNYIRAEKLLKRAVEIMPTDPIVNDHYGDILWKLGRKIEAGYFWKNVLTFDDTENDMKETINNKILNGLI